MTSRDTHPAKRQMGLGVTLDALLDRLAAQPETGAVALYLWRPQTQRLEYAGGRGVPEEAVRAGGFRKGEGRIGAVASGGDGFIAPLDPTDRRSPALDANGLKARVVHPMRIDGDLVGVLEVFLSDVDGGAEAFYGFAAEQAAVAIRNAQELDAGVVARRELERAYDKTVEGWSRAVSLRDRGTEGHTVRVTGLTIKMGRAMSLSDEEMIHLRRGSLLHDVGKMEIPDRILHKQERLTEEEWEIMRQHPLWGYEILSAIPFLHPAIDIPYCHHERWNGSGYPRGIQGEEIPLAARIFAVTDVWDAMTSDRTYRKAIPPHQVRSTILQSSGSLFDPQVIEVFSEVVPRQG